MNFSVVGRDCSLEQRLHYFEYDYESNERNNILEDYEEMDNLDAVIGSQISIDITQKV